MPPIFMIARVPRRSWNGSLKQSLLCDESGPIKAIKVPKGPLVEWVKKTFSCELEVVSRKGKKFKVLPRRWVVERTFAWLSRYRRLVREYEKKPASSMAMIYVASIRIMLKKCSLKLMKSAPHKCVPLNLCFSYRLSVPVR